VPPTGPLVPSPGVSLVGLGSTSPSPLSSQSFRLPDPLSPFPPLPPFPQEATYYLKETVVREKVDSYGIAEKTGITYIRQRSTTRRCGQIQHLANSVALSGCTFHVRTQCMALGNSVPDNRRYRDKGCEKKALDCHCHVGTRLQPRPQSKETRC
jgi:hypothetical protein